MATLLYRLGRISARRPWRVIAGWIAVLVVAGGAFLLGGSALSSGFSIPGTPTAKINDQLADELPDLGGATGTVVFQTNDGSALDADQRAQIADVLEGVAGVTGVARIIDPFETASQRAEQEQQVADGFAQLDAASPYLTPEQLAAQTAPLLAAERLLDAASAIRTVSEDASTAAGAVIFEEGQLDLPDDVKAAVAEHLDGAGIAGVDVTYSSEIAAGVDGLIGPGEIVGLLIAAVVLIVMLGSLLSASLPLISSLVGVGIGVAGSLTLAGVVDMSSVTPVLGVMLGLAVGIDYSLFIINRHRRQLMLGMEVHESIGLANGTSGSAVLFAGSTVLIALLALNITGIPFLAVMGTVGAVCVLIAVLIAVTFTPALLGIVGARVLVTPCTRESRPPGSHR